MSNIFWGSYVDNVLITDKLTILKNMENKAKLYIVSRPLDNSLNLSIMGGIGD